MNKFLKFTAGMVIGFIIATILYILLLIDCQDMFPNTWWC